MMHWYFLRLNTRIILHLSLIHFCSSGYRIIIKHPVLMEFKIFFSQSSSDFTDNIEVGTRGSELQIYLNNGFKSFHY